MPDGASFVTFQPYDNGIIVNTANFPRSSMVFFFDADDTAGNNSFNVPPPVGVFRWKNKERFSNANDFIAFSAASTHPTFIASGVNGHPALNYNGTSNRSRNSQDVGFIHKNMIFDIFMVLAIDDASAFRPIMANAFTGSDQGFLLYSSPTLWPGRFYVSIVGQGGANIATLYPSTASFSAGVFLKINIRGDGNNLYFSSDFSNYDVIPATFPLGNASATYNMVLGASANQSVFFDGAVAMVALYERFISQKEKQIINDIIFSRYGI
ncbi:MAG: hypothetical protein ACRC2O_06665 [Chitinophagaceae bacterium]